MLTPDFQPKRSLQEDNRELALPGEDLGAAPLEIRFYRPQNSYFCFTNFSPHSIELQGRTWPTSEHFYQSQKFMQSDPDWAEKIRQAPTPLAAAGMGRDIRHAIRADWELIKDNVMRLAVATKVLAHAEVRDALLSTGQAVLIVDSAKDFYWGCGANGNGKNMLGQILMQIRNALQANDGGLRLAEYIHAAQTF